LLIIRGEELKILHIIPNLPLLNETTAIGGSASALWTLVQKQSEHHEVYVASNLIPIGNHDIYKEERKVKLIDLRINSKRRTKLFALKFIIKILTNGIIWGSDVQIIHVHSGFLDYIIIAAVLSTIFQIPTFYSAYCPAMTSSLIVHLGLMIINMIPSANVTVIPISLNIMEYLESVGFHPEKMHMIHPSLNIDKIFQEIVDTKFARQELGLPSDKPILLFIGNYRPEKNLRGTVQIIDKVKQTIPNILLIATTELSNQGDKKNKDEILSYIKNHKLEENVKLVGIVNNIYKLISAADICIFPFLHTRGPSDYFMAALEAMLLSKPVISSPVGGMVEVINDGVDGLLIKSNELDLWSRNIINLLHNDKKRIQIGENAKRNISDSFNVKIIDDDLDRLYKTKVVSK
jgi:glycosyltransferase involved in cell wall biosynthesis